MIKGVSETIEHEAKEKKVGFLCLLMATLSARLLWNILEGNAKIPGWGVVRVCEETIRAGHDF